MPEESLLELPAILQVCHSEPLGEESLLSAKDSLSKHQKARLVIRAEILHPL